MIIFLSIIIIELRNDDKNDFFSFVFKKNYDYVHIKRFIIEKFIQ
jgi:hypothetical protein